MHEHEPVEQQEAEPIAQPAARSLLAALGSPGPASILAAQRSAGNRAVAQLIARRGTGATATSSEARVRALRTQLASAETAAVTKGRPYAPFAREARGSADTLREHADTASATYERAYGAFRTVLGRGGERAAQIDYAEDVAINVALSIIIAVGWEVVAAEAAASAAGAAGARAATTLAQSARTAGIQSTGANVATSNPAGPSVSGGLFPNRGDRNTTLGGQGGRAPASRQLQFYRSLTDLYRGIAIVDEAGLSYLEAIGDVRQVRTQVDGLPDNADDATLTPLEQRAGEIRRAIDAAPDPEQQFQQIRRRLERLNADIGDFAQREDERSMERRIWIGWIANIPRHLAHEVLDLNPIEDHLAAIGVIGTPGEEGGGALGVNFGRWTDSDDTSAAQAAASASVRDEGRQRRRQKAERAVGETVRLSVSRGATNSMSATLPGDSESLPARVPHLESPPEWYSGRTTQVTGWEQPGGEPTLIVAPVS